MSYDLELYFRSPEFPEKEWLEILSWFDAIERIDSSEINRHPTYWDKFWFIQVGGYGVFCSIQGRYPNDLFRDDKTHWRVPISTGSGFGLRQFFGYTLCYYALSLIPETSAWDCGQYFDSLYQKPDKFLRKVNAVIATHHLFEKHESKLEMQQMEVMDENFQLIPDPHLLKLGAQSALYDG